jgi:hypothetical protein
LKSLYIVCALDMLQNETSPQTGGFYMKRIPMIAAITFVITLTLTACQQRNNDSLQHARAIQESTDHHLKARSNNPHTDGGHGNPSVIPSVDRVKTRTTNEYGTTSYGMGSSVYSIIGSSGLHSEGISSHLESRLSGAGIDGVKVFTLDDRVILAAEKRTKTSSRYDPLQHKVLSNTGGQSGRGPEPYSSEGTFGSGGAKDDNMELAAEWVRNQMGQQVKIMKVIDPEAVKVINRIRSKDTASPRALSADIRKLLELASNRGGQTLTSTK